MSTGALVVLIIAGLVILALGAVLLRLELRARRLRARFGPEYDRVRESGPWGGCATARGSRPGRRGRRPMGPKRLNPLNPPPGVGRAVPVRRAHASVVHSVGACFENCAGVANLWRGRPPHRHRTTHTT